MSVQKREGRRRTPPLRSEGVRTRKVTRPVDPAGDTKRGMHYVYILRAKGDATQHYVGYSADLRSRLKEHASATRGYTSQRDDWALHWYCAFHEEPSARAFERYLKSGSGRAFARRHL